MGSPDKAAGFALGALLAGDRDASSVREQVAGRFHEAVRTHLTQVATAGDKRAALSLLIECVRPEPTTLEGLPAAAQALLQCKPPKRRPAGTRADYAPDPNLVAMLKRLAAKHAVRGPT